MVYTFIVSLALIAQLSILTETRESQLELCTNKTRDSLADVIWDIYFDENVKCSGHSPRISFNLEKLYKQINYEDLLQILELISNPVKATIPAEDYDCYWHALSKPHEVFFMAIIQYLKCESKFGKK